MKGILTMMALFPLGLSAQPLSGSYTVGGLAPDYITLQAAANAVKVRGLSGPVTFNIRPGVYLESGGQGSVMILDSTIAGSSPTNRISFQPDAAAGGTVDNVILQIDLATPASTALVRISTNYVTIRSLTFQDIDTSGAGADALLQVSNAWGINPTGIIVDGCRFIGNPHPTGGMTYGTDYGIYADLNVTSIEVRNNSFRRLMRAVSIGNSTGITSRAIVEDNQVLSCHWGTTVTGGWRGYGIMAQAINVVVRRNFLDNTEGRGSLSGIYVQADTGLVERNNILNGPGLVGNAHSPVYSGVTVHGISVWGGVAKSMLVVNNSISVSGITPTNNQSSRFGIDVRTKKVEIIHNTILQHSGAGKSRGIQMNPGSDSCMVLNNIIIDYNGTPSWPDDRILFSQTWGEAGLISDYNVFYYYETSPGITIVARSGTFYTNLNLYQAATGLDSNSIFKQINFAQYPHLSDCQAQDPKLGGIPYPGIVDDIDGDPRSLTAPTRGADEGRLRANAMFEDVFRIPLLGTAFSMAAAKFDNLIADGLAITDYNNNRVHLYHNTGRSFTHSQTLQLGFTPSAVRFFDLDRDGYLDLVVGGYNPKTIRVFWGDGAGGFPQDTSITPRGDGVRSIDTGRVSFHNLRTVVLTEPLSPGKSFLTYLYNGNGRHLVHHTVIRPRPGGGTEPDTIYAVLNDFAVGDLDGNESHEVAALGVDGWAPALPFIVFKDTTFGNIPWGQHTTNHSFHTAGYLGFFSNIAMGRFTGGALSDIITTGVDLSECIFLRNQGNLNFTAEPIAANEARGLAALDYDNDGDLDFATVNWSLEDNGISVFLNDGAGNFTQEFNCYQSFGSGEPWGVIASDFDVDGKTDLAIIATASGGYDSLFVLYNTGNVTGVGTDPSPGTPTEFSLSQNYPNPFNPTTTIRYAIPVESHVSLTIYNILGQEVERLVDGVQPAGNHWLRWDGRNHQGWNLSSGVYFYRLEARAVTGQSMFSSVKKMLLLK